MALIKEPFQNYTLDEDKVPYAKRLTVRIDKQEEEWLEYLKRELNIGDDATIVRMALDVFENVVRSRFPRKKRAWLFKKDRKRRLDY